MSLSITCFRTSKFPYLHLGPSETSKGVITKYKLRSIICVLGDVSMSKIATVNDSAPTSIPNTTAVDPYVNCAFVPREFSGRRVVSWDKSLIRI